MRNGAFRTAVLVVSAGVLLGQVPNPDAPKENPVSIQTEVVIVTPDGARPNRLVRTAGPFFLSIKRQNLTAPSENLTFVPSTAIPDAGRLKGIVDTVSWERKGRSIGFVDLPPGEYRLQIAPDNTICTIVLQGESSK